MHGNIFGHQILIKADIMWKIYTKNKERKLYGKIDWEFATYIIVEHYFLIEKKLHVNMLSSQGERSICTALHHRFCSVYLTSEILRGESVYQVVDGRVGGQSFLYTWLHCECCG